MEKISSLIILALMAPLPALGQTTLNLDYPAVAAQTYTDAAGNKYVFTAPSQINVGTLSWPTGSNPGQVTLPISVGTEATYTATDANGNSVTVAVPSNVTYGTLAITPAPPPVTPPAIVGSGRTRIAGGTSATFTIPNVAVGNTVIVGLAWCGGGTSCGSAGGTSTPTVTDAVGNVIPAAIVSKSAVTWDEAAFAFPVTVASASDTITVHFSAAVDYPIAHWTQVSNVRSTVDGTPQSGTSTATLSLPISTTVSGDFVYSLWNGSSCPAPGTGETILNEACASSGEVDAYKVSGAAGSYPQTATSAGGTMTGLAFALKPK